MDKVKDLDLYKLLDIDTDATEKDIKKAYRKKALTCHPDKNPDDEKAIQRFHQLSDALKVLTDEAARKAYDNLLKARKAHELRNRELDSKRRKLKDDLERREKAATEAQQTYNKQAEEDKLFAEIERLRKQGSKQLEEEQELMKAELAKPTIPENDAMYKNKDANKLKLKWKGQDSRYDSESLTKIFNKYDDVLNVIISSKSGKNNSTALIEMKTEFGARNAFNIERGFSDNPLKVKLIGNSDNNLTSSDIADNSSSASSNNLTKETDYETLVMRKLRQEQERKRLIQEMMEEDNK